MSEHMTAEIRALHEELILLVEAHVRKWKAAGVKDIDIVPAVLTVATNICGAMFARIAICDPNPRLFMVDAGPMIAEQAIERALAEIESHGGSTYRPKGKRLDG